MQDMLKQLYNFVDEFLPVVRYPDDAQRALEATFTPEQEALWEDYQREAFHRMTRSGGSCLTILVRLGLHIP